MFPIGSKPSVLNRKNLNLRQTTLALNHNANSETATLLTQTSIAPVLSPKTSNFTSNGNVYNNISSRASSRFYTSKSKRNDSKVEDLQGKNTTTSELQSQESLFQKGKSGNTKIEDETTNKNKVEIQNNNNNNNNNNSNVALSSESPSELPELLRLAKEKKIKLFGTFSGQGFAWISELKFIATNFPSTRPFIRKCCEQLEEFHTNPNFDYRADLVHGFRVLDWFENEESVPDEAYLGNAIISLPMICLTQISSILALCHKYNITSSEFRKFFSGFSGHSQGVLAAIILSVESTPSHFENVTIEILKLTSLISSYLQHSLPFSACPQRIINESQALGFGTPSCMLLIQGLRKVEVDSALEEFNSLYDDPVDKVSIALVNTQSNIVVSGNPAIIHNFRVYLDKIHITNGSAGSSADVLYSERKKLIHCTYIPSSAPFHSHHGTALIPEIKKKIIESNLELRQELTLPVYSCNDGANLQFVDDVVDYIVNMTVKDVVYWDDVCKIIVNEAKPTHIIDFGPGSSFKLLLSNTKGSGISIIEFNNKEEGKEGWLRVANPGSTNWIDSYHPRLLRSSSQNNNNDFTKLETRFTRVYKQPPILVAGMTPSTAHAEVVAAATRAGYYAELAAGGLPTPELFEKEIHLLTSLIEPGQSIHVNIIILNAALWNFQFQSCLELRRRGYPIESIVIAAGVPSVEKAAEIITAMKEVGIYRVGFKPGSQSGIETVLSIAAEHKDVSILMEWTGGRAGGHHSLEDQNEPIIKMYHQIREHDNIILICGGGIGDPSDAWKYLSGDWSSVATMPFDGVLLGSRMMVAKECFTDSRVKSVIVNTPGVADDQNWPKTLSPEGANGIRSIKSELNENIHVVDNRLSRLWRDLDVNYFAKYRDAELENALSRDKPEIIQRLNSDNCKLYFPQHIDGSVASDITELSYFEVTSRLLQFSLIENDWLDVTFGARWKEWTCRAIERCNIAHLLSDHLSDEYFLRRPSDLLNVLQKYSDQQLSSKVVPEDKLFFIDLCRRANWKPCNFIPAVDKDLKFWLKKDSLFYSEDFRAVPENDPERVLILQGPVAVRHSTKANETIKEILDSFNTSFINFVKEKENLLPSTPVSYVLPSDTVDLSPTLHALFTEHPYPWIKAIITSKLLDSNGKWKNNPIKSFLTMEDIRIDLNNISNDSGSILIYDSSDESPVITIEFKDNAVKTTIRFDYDLFNAPKQTSFLEVIYGIQSSTSAYTGDGDYVLIEEARPLSNRKYNQFYSELWQVQNTDLSIPNFRDWSWKSPIEKVSEAHIKAFLLGIGEHLPFWRDSLTTHYAPLDFAFVVAWPSFAKAMMTSLGLSETMLKGVHLQHRYEIISPRFRNDLRTGEKKYYFCKGGESFFSTAKLTSCIERNGGENVTCFIQVFRVDDQNNTTEHMMNISSSCWLPSNPNEPKKNSYEEISSSFELPTSSDVMTLLKTKAWHNLPAEYTPSSSISFQITSISDHVSWVSTTGVIKENSKTIAEIKYESNQSPICIVSRFLKDHGVSKDDSSDDFAIDSENYVSLGEIVAPANMKIYSKLGRDVNPLHTSRFIARLAGFDSPIVHGMYTNSQIRRLIELTLKDQAIDTLTTDFMSPVLPSEKLSVTLYPSLKQKNGKSYSTILVKNAQDITVSSSKLVSSNKYPTALMFTGQGSAFKGMGMNLYNSHSEEGKLSQETWNSVESFFKEKYGVSLLYIIMENPKNLFISWKGKSGLKVKENWIQVFPRAEELSGEFDGLGFELKSPNGVLFRTEFQQAAIVVYQFAEMQRLRLIGENIKNAVVAGHSVGEFSALVSVLSTIPVHLIAEIVFKRGLIMQGVIPRDENGASPYAMAAVNLSKGKLSVEDLQSYIQSIEKLNNNLLQIVNWNAKQHQYVVAGERVALQVLANLLDGSDSISNLEKAFDSAKQTLENNSALTRHKSFIPLKDIDIPFHSRIFLSQVHKLRSALTELFDSIPSLSYKSLVNTYVPNILGNQFFAAEPSFVESVYEVTQSETVQTLLSELSNSQSNAANSEIFLKKLLIECLSYQFALPVQWINTQELLLKSVKLSSFIEVGPTATLVPLLKRVYIAAEKSHVQPFGYTYTARWSEEQPEATPKPAVASPSSPPSSSSAKPAAAVQEVKPQAVELKSEPAVAKVSSSAVRSKSGSPIQFEFNSVHLLKLLLSHKLKVGLPDIHSGKTIRELCGGRSALQNEIMADIQKEFTINGEGLEQLPVSGAAEKLKINSSAPFNGIVENTLKKIGVNRSTMSNYWVQQWNVSPSSIPVLVTHASASNLIPDQIDGESALHAWLDKVITNYCEFNGLPMVSKPSVGSEASNLVQVAAIDPKQFESLKKLLEKKRDAIDQFIKDSKDDNTEEETEDEVSSSASEVDLDDIIKEHGIHYLQGIQPQFDQFKVRHYDSWKHWARLSLVQFILNSVRKPGFSFDHLYDLKNEKAFALRSQLHSFSTRSFANLRELLQGQLLKYQINEDVGRSLLSLLDQSLNSPPKFKENAIPMAPSQLPNGTFTESPRYSHLDDMSYRSYVKDMTNPSHHYRFNVSRALTNSQKDITTEEINAVFSSSLEQLVTTGLTFTRTTALLIGAGKGSIASFVVKNLLMGGAHVIIANASITSQKYKNFQDLYQKYGAKGSKLSVVPFNGVSKQDAQDLVDFLWRPKSAGGLEVGAPDFVFPFAALAEKSTTIGDIDDQSELSHRAMLTNVHRLVGKIGDRMLAEKKPGKMHLGASQSQIVIPLSPNHGIFGYDGLYAESKLGLRSLFMKSKSEPWGQCVNVIGAEIGWTRSTNLMSSHDSVSYSIESELNLLTFNQVDMALNLTALLHPNVIDLNVQHGPLVANFTGGFKSVDGEVCEVPLARIRQQAMQIAIQKKRLEREKLLDNVLHKKSQDSTPPSTGFSLKPRAQLQNQFKFPKVPAAPTASPLQGMIDLTQVVVVVGYGEVGPYGNHRTRWEWETSRGFSKEGAIELARALGLIKFQRPSLLGRGEYIGWIDTKTKKPVDDHKVWELYKDTLVAHTGIRFIDPADTPFAYDPKNKETLKQIEVEEDLPPFEVTSKEDEVQLLKKYGNLVEIVEKDRKVMATLKKGAMIFVSKSREFDRKVAALLPKGWDPTLAYGIPSDIVNSIDPVSVYAVCATMDALISAGIRDPYELYQYVHITEVGTALGSGMGGGQSLRKAFRERFIGDESIESDTIQESLINTPAAWVNMLLMSSSGPIKPQVGACATAASSVDTAVDSILRGKAKVMIAGGVETFTEEGSTEFRMMNATSNSDYEQKIGYSDPENMSRPCSSTRSGFMESKGCGIQILMSADVALKMGCPIYAIIGCTSTASDKQGRSVPAPGQGLLSVYKDIPVVSDDEKHPQFLNSPLLSVEYRRKQFENHLSTLSLSDHKLQYQRAQQLWGTNFYMNDPNIAPMKGALSVWGLSVDDIDVISFHGTGTKANDANETNMIHRAFCHLGRSEGNPVFSIFQKSITGHGKGAAAAWALNGLLQSFDHGIVPANRNGDNIDSHLDPYSHILFTNENMNVHVSDSSSSHFKSGIVQSFGFGQAGSSILLIHPNYLYHSIDSQSFNNYVQRRKGRYDLALSHWLDHIYSAEPRSLIEIKTSPPYPDSEFQNVILNSLSRAPHFANHFYNHHLKSFNRSSSPTTASSSSSSSSQYGFGIDVEEHSTFTDFYMKENFITKNFNAKEISQCNNSIRPVSTYTGKWCAKEAVVKAFCSLKKFDSMLFEIGKDQSAALIDIEISNEHGAPSVVLYGKMKELSDSLNISESDIRVSISHTGTFSCAQCIIGNPTQPYTEKLL